MHCFLLNKRSFKVQGELSEAKWRQAEKDVAQSQAERQHLSAELERRNATLTRAAADAKAALAQMEAQVESLRASTASAVRELAETKENHREDVVLLERRMEAKVRLCMVYLKTTDLLLALSSAPLVFLWMGWLQRFSYG